MRIRTRLTLQFVGIVALIVFCSHLAIYYLSAQYRENQFYDRLRAKAYTTAELLIKVDAVSADLLRIIDKNKKDILFQENITVYNYLDDIVYTNNDNFDFGFSSDFLDKIRIEGEQRVANGDVELVGVQYVDDYNRFVITASAIDKFGRQKLQNLRNTLAISFLAILCVVAAAGWIYAGRALRPISHIVKQVNNISATNLSTRLDEGNKIDEIAQLSATFNEMLDRIETTFQLQKTFVANASHELKNPLTIITSQVEVILLRERTPEEYRQTLTSVLEDVRRLNQVSLRLLDLARLSSDETKIELKPLRIDELIWKCKEELMEKRPEYKVVFAPELPEEERQLIIMANEDLLTTAFLNIMDNACKFSPDREVTVLLESRGSRSIVKFRDRGIGISAAELPFIFQPFYRSTAAVSVAGHGIGLSLVEKILKFHKAQVEVYSRLEAGTTFTVTIPAASIL